MCLLASGAFACAALADRVGLAQPPEGGAAPATQREPAPVEARAFGDLANAPPPPTSYTYLQYGVAFTAEVVSAPGPLCDNKDVPCILGPGGGVAVRAGWRGRGALYLGGAYELSKQDPNKLYRLAILQQVRAEGRLYFRTARDVEPFGAAGTGVSGYGNEWGVDTWGPQGFLGVGLEAQITRHTLVGVAFAYRFLWFRSFTDTSGADRSAGLAQVFGLDLMLEQRDPIVEVRPKAL